jgi:hypothetical protein
MKCTGKQWDHCRVEKMVCKCCHYDENKNQEIEEYINNMSEEEMNDFIFFALKAMTKKVDNVKSFLESEDKRIKKALHKFGNQKRNEYSGVLLGKAEIIRTIRRIIDE